MNIVEAIKCIKAQKAVRRANWSGDKFLYYVPAAAYPAVTSIAKSIANNNGKVAITVGIFLASSTNFE